MRNNDIGPIWDYVLKNTNDSNGNKHAALVILRALIQHGNYDELFAVQNGIAYGWTSQGSDIIEELFRNKKGFAEVNAFVRTNIASKDRIKKMSAFRLLILLNKFEQIEDFFFLKNLISLLDEYDNDLRGFGIEQFERYLKDGKYLDSAIEYVMDHLESEKWLSKEAAYRLLSYLVQHGHCEEMALDLTIQRMSEPQLSSQSLASFLIPKLIDKRKGIDQFFSFVKEHWNSSEYRLRKRSEELMSQLANIGHFPS